jgi:hypothetical protein
VARWQIFDSVARLLVVYAAPLISFPALAQAAGKALGVA